MRMKAKIFKICKFMKTRKKICLAATVIVSITDNKVIVDTNNFIFSTNSMVPGPLGPAPKLLGNFDLVK